MDSEYLPQGTPPAPMCTDSDKPSTDDQPQTFKRQHSDLEPPPPTSAPHGCPETPSSSSTPSQNSTESLNSVFVIEPIVNGHVSEIKSMWNLVKLYQKLGTRQQAIAFAEENGMIQTSRFCTYHKKPMSVIYSTNNTVGSFICNRGKCRTKSKVSRAKNTIFENVRISIQQIFYLIYAFANKWNYEQTMKEDFTNKDQCLSRATISDWFTSLSEAVVIYQIERQSYMSKIGGPGKVVHINESKFGKRKFNKGCYIEGCWVLVLVEDGSKDLRLELCLNNIRSADVLVPLVKKHIAEGTTVHTNWWKAYDCLGEHGYIHKKVKCCDPENPLMAADGTHTKRIGAQWRIIKRYFQNYYNINENFTDLLYEYLWGRDIVKYKRDPFDKLIKVVNYVYK